MANRPEPIQVVFLKTALRESEPPPPKPELVPLPPIPAATSSNPRNTNPNLVNGSNSATMTNPTATNAVPPNLLGSLLVPSDVSASTVSSSATATNPQPSLLTLRQSSSDAPNISSAPTPASTPQTLSASTFAPSATLKRSDLFAVFTPTAFLNAGNVATYMEMIQMMITADTQLAAEEVEALSKRFQLHDTLPQILAAGAVSLDALFAALVHSSLGIDYSFFFSITPSSLTLILTPVFMTDAMHQRGSAE